MNITDTLSKINQWWTTNAVPLSFLYPATRKELSEIISLLPEGRITAIIGPRRTGKSILLYQIVQHLLSENVENKRILFFSGDDPALFFSSVSISDILNSYCLDILHEPLEQLSKTIYVLIDEVHTLENWQQWTKKYYDQKMNIKFIISGSSSTHLFHGSRESLLGRIDYIPILPFDFSQFCHFWSVYEESQNLSDFSLLLPSFSFLDSPREYFEHLQSDRWRFSTYTPLLHKVLKEYLLVGGYPEYFSNKDILMWQKRLSTDIVNQGLYRDVVYVYQIKNPERLEQLLYFIAANNGQDFNFKTIADTLHCDNETVSKYLAYLEQAYLILIQHHFSRNAGKGIRKNKKLYIHDNGLANALLHYNEIDSTREGFLLENSCVQFVQNYANAHGWKTGYYRGENTEIDIIVDKHTRVQPIEVKFRNRMPCVSSFSVFSSHNKSIPMEKPIVITKNQLEETNQYIAIPFYLIH
jgi:predicted AAA+ superfamily ATPase